jgi:hypothetical protein
MNAADPTTRLNAALEDRYRIGGELGQGGMATVYLADDLKHERKVALKVLKPELAAVVGAERFLAEIKTAVNLQHPHILPLFDSGEADGFLFYVMPFVEGESLRERLDREKQLGVDEMSSQLAEPVAHAGWAGLDWLARDETAQVGGEIVGRGVATSTILLDRLHDDPVQVTTQLTPQRAHVGPPIPRHGLLGIRQRTQASARRGHVFPAE